MGASGLLWRSPTFSRTWPRFFATREVWGLVESVESYLVEVVMPSGKADIEIKRHLSPLTAERLYRNLPKRALVVRDGPKVYLFVEMTSKLEKGRRELRRGEVAFVPSKEALLIALKRMRLPSPVLLLGRVVSGLEVFESAATGQTAHVRRKDEP